MWNGDVAHQVREEHHAAFEDADEQQILPDLVVAGNLRAQLGHARLQFLLVNQNFLKILFIRLWHEVRSGCE